MCSPWNCGLQLLKTSPCGLLNVGIKAEVLQPDDPSGSA